MVKFRTNHIFCVLLLTFVLAVLPEVTSAQILKGLGKKIEKKIERETNRRVERKVDKAINKGMDKVEQTAEEAVRGDGKTETKDSPKKSPYDFRLGGKSNVSLADTYAFKLGVTYDIENNKKNKTQTTMWFGGEDYIGMTVPMQKNVFMIMHGGNMITFMQQEKKYMVLGVDVAQGMINAAAEEAKNEEEDFEIKKIGTEKLLNYNCNVYEVKSSEYVMKLWLTEEIGVDVGSFMSAFSTIVKEKGKFPAMKNQPGGLLLKMESKSLKDKEVMNMTASSIDKTGMSINTSDYSSLSF